MLINLEEFKTTVSAETVLARTTPDNLNVWVVNYAVPSEFEDEDWETFFTVGTKPLPEGVVPSPIEALEWYTKRQVNGEVVGKRVIEWLGIYLSKLSV